METPLTCPECQKVVPLGPEPAGTATVECPSCRTPVPVPDAEGGETAEAWRTAETLADERPELAPEWRSVSAGLRLVYWGMSLIVVTVGLLFVLGMLLSVAVPGDDAPFLMGPPASGVESFTLGFGFFLVLITAAILFITGFVRCARAPQESGGRGAARLARNLLLTGVAMAVAGPVLLGMDLSGLGNLFGFAATIAFLVFLGRIGRHLLRSDLQARARRVLWLHILPVLIVVALAGSVAVVGSPPPSDGWQALAGLLGLLVFGLMLFAIIGFLRLTRATREAVLDTGGQPPAAAREAGEAPLSR